MGSHTSYQVVHTVVISHDYFTDSTCRVDLVPTGATLRAMNNGGFLFRQQDACTWVVLCSKVAGSHSTALDFEIRHHAPSFYYYSRFDDDVPKDASYSLTYVGKKGVWALMTVSADAFDGSDRTSVIPIRSKEKYWEIILFSKYGKLSDRLTLEDEQGHLSFSEGTPVEVPGVAYQALRFVSLTPVSLRDRYPYRIRLMEQLRQSRITLCGIAAPQPAVSSHFDPQGAITVYCYC